MFDKQQTWARTVAGGRQHLIGKKFQLEHWTLGCGVEVRTHRAAAASQEVVPPSLAAWRTVTEPETEHRSSLSSSSFSFSSRQH